MPLRSDSPKAEAFAVSGSPTESPEKIDQAGSILPTSPIGQTGQICETSTTPGTAHLEGAPQLRRSQRISGSNAAYTYRDQGLWDQDTLLALERRPISQESRRSAGSSGTTFSIHSANSDNSSSNCSKQDGKATAHGIIPPWAKPIYFPKDPWAYLFNDVLSFAESVDKLHEVYEGQLAPRHAERAILDRYQPKRGKTLYEAVASAKTIEKTRLRVSHKLTVLRKMLECDDEWRQDQRVGIVLYMLLRNREWGSEHDESNLMFLDGELSKWQAVYDWKSKF